MAKFAGNVGYVTDVETSLGVWQPQSTIRKMSGDILRTASVFQGTDVVSENVTLQHRVSVLGDGYAFQNYFNIKWVEYSGIKWEVTMITIERPRIILTLGRRWSE